MLALHQQYILLDVITGTGHKLYKGGRVQLIAVLRRNLPVDLEDATKYYGFDPATQKKAIAGVMIPFKEDRYVLERVEPVGKTIVLLAKYLQFISEIGGVRTEAKIEYTSLEVLLDELRVGQTFSSPSSVLGTGRMQVMGFQTNAEGVRTHVTLSYENKLRSGEVIWMDGQPMPIDLFARCVISTKITRVS